MALPRTDQAKHKPAPPTPAPSLRGYWVSSFLRIALVLLLASALAIYLWWTRDQAQQRRLLERGTDILVQAITADLAPVRRTLEGLRSDPGLQAAFASRDPLRLQAAAQALSARMPGALEVHLFTPEQMASGQGIPTVSYAGLDLARQAARDGSATRVEVHKVGQPGMHLALAAPVLDPKGEGTIGVAHVTLPLSLLPQPGSVVGEGGAIFFQQVVGPDVATLPGDQALPGGAPDYEAPIGGTRLRVAGWINDRDLLDPWLAAQLALAYLVVLGLVGAALWPGYRAARRHLIEDTEGLAAMVDDALHRRPLRKNKSGLAETQVAREALSAALRRLQPRIAKTGGAGSLDDESDNDLLGPSFFPGGAGAEEDELAMLESEDADGTGRAQAPGGRQRSPAEDFDALKALYDELPAGESFADAVPASIFRAYDIRGLVDSELTTDTMNAIGRALGSEALARGDDTLMIGRDLRASSPGLAAALSEGIRAAGPDVVDLGVVPAPLVYFACCHPALHSGAVVTASHNPPEYNGVKPVLLGESASAETLQMLRGRIEQGQFSEGNGGYRREDLSAQYRGSIAQDVALARHLDLVIDAGNATASTLAPQLFRDLGCDVVELNCDMEAGMGERVPDPSVPEQLRDLGNLVRAKGADLGLAFDGDADRLGVVDSAGRFIAADRVLMLFAADVLARHPGSDVVFDVKCSRHLADEIRRAGGRPLMWKSGHTPLKAKLRESGALIAGELSGHFIFKDRWFGFDDALYAGARLLEILSLDPRPSEEIFAALPGGIATPELFLPLEEGESERIMDAVLRLAERSYGANLILIDGLRAEIDGGWGLVRASNTQPKLSFRFEGDDQESLDKVQALFRQLMNSAAPGLTLPF